MKLVLDEHLSPTIAVELRRRRHEVVAAAEVGLSQQSDAALLARAVAEGWAVVTANYGDFRELHRLYLSRGEHHLGIVFVPRRFSLAQSGFGLIIAALDKLLNEHVNDTALENAEIWLSE